MLAQSIRPNSASTAASAGAPTALGDLRGAVAVEVDDPDQLDAGQGGVLLGVEGAEVADADDRGAHRRQAPSARTPTMARSAADAALEQRLALEQERLARFQGEHGDAGLAADGDRGRADRRDVEAQVLSRLAHLDRHGTAVRQRAAAAQRRIGAFERLDGEHDARFHHDGLADVPRPDAFGDGQAVLDVAPLCGVGLAHRERSLGGEDRGQKQGRLDHRDALAFELLGDAAQQRVVAPLRQPGEEALRALVGGEVLHQRRLADTARHDGAAHAVRLKGADDDVELPDLDPGDVVDHGAELRRGLPLVRHGHHPHSLLPRRAGEEDRKGAVAGDQADVFHARGDRGIYRGSPTGERGRPCA